MKKILRRFCKWYLIYSCKHKFREVSRNYPDAYIEFICEKCKKLKSQDL